MTQGILERLPNIGPLQQIADVAAGNDVGLVGQEASPIAALVDLVNIVDTLRGPLDLAALTTVMQDLVRIVQPLLAQLDSADLEPILGSLTDTLNRLSAPLGFDVSGLVTQLPATLTTLQTLMPEDILEQVETIRDTYTTLSSFIENSALVQSGEFSQEAALADLQAAFTELQEPLTNLLGQALTLLGDQLGDLPADLMPLTELERIQSAFDQATSLASALPTEPAEVLPFVTERLLAVVNPETVLSLLADLNQGLPSPEPDLLNAPVLAVQAAIAPTLTTLTPTVATLANTVAVCDVADPDDYVQLAAGLEAVQAELTPALNAALAPLDQFYTDFEALLDSPEVAPVFTVLETLFIEYPNQVAALVGGDSITGLVTQVNDAISQILNSLLTGVSRGFEGASGVLNQLQDFSGTLRRSFETSGILSIYETLRSFLLQLQTVSQSFSPAALQTLLEDLLSRIQTELEALGLGDITAAIEQDLTDLQTFITESLDQTFTANALMLVDAVVMALQRVTQPLEDITAQVMGVIEQINGLFATIQTEFQETVDTLAGFVSQVEAVNFQPVGDLAVTEIDEIRTRLQAIDPTTLSEPERLAIKAALSLLEAIDLPGVVVPPLNDGFQQAQDVVRQQLDRLTQLLDQVRLQILSYSPEVLLQPVFDVLDQAMGFVELVNSTFLLSPVYDQVDSLTSQISAIAPAQILTPLQAPYATVVGAINRLRPDQWLAPVVALYEQINPTSLLNVLDVESLLDELQAMQQQLFSQVSTTLRGLLSQISVPAALQPVFDPLQTLLETLLDAIFSGGELGGSLDVATLLAPLDQLFDQLLEHVDPLLQNQLDTLLTTLDPIRETFNALDFGQISPAALLRRFGLDPEFLSTLAPAALLAVPQAITDLRQSLLAKADDVPAEQTEAFTAIVEQFDTLLVPFDATRPDGLLTRLHQTYERVVNALQQRLNLPAATAAYTSLMAAIPDFLLTATPLTDLTPAAVIDLIRSGIEALRPSRLASASLTRTQQLPTLAFGPTVNRFFSDLRAVVMQIDPRPLLEIVQAVYDTFDPAQLVTTLQTLFDAIAAPLDALNPATIIAQLNTLFEDVITALSTSVRTVIDAIAIGLDDQLTIIRDLLNGPILLVRTVIDQATALLQQIIREFERFLFVELIGRLERIIDNLGISFDQEINRVVNAFDQMLQAIPV